VRQLDAMTTSLTDPNDDSTDIWRSDVYAKNAAFVPALAADLLDVLDPRSGERVLDLGCGDGVLTAQIASRGAIVVGVDASPSMVAAALSRGLDARVVAAESLPFEREFEAVFSNAMIHWTSDIGALVGGVARALAPGGRFIGEFGGHGNVAAIVESTREALAAIGITLGSPWYYPDEATFRSTLEAHGFEVDRLVLFPRPTPLPTGLAGWLETFSMPLVRQVPVEQRAHVLADIVRRAEPRLRTADGTIAADYVRLRFTARSTGEGRR
jgi:SAM-dependent methyltransferase